MVTIFKLYKHRYEVVLVCSCIAVLGIALYNTCTGRRGSWSCDLPAPVALRLPPSVTDSDSSASKGERRVQSFLQRTFQRPFEKQRPKFLSNPVTGGNYNLELDCYNEELRLAVEFNGRQHYEYVPFFHRNKEAFLNQKYRDEMKRQRCYDRGIVLIEVPYTEEPRVESFLRQKLREYQHLRDAMVGVNSVSIDI